MLIHVHLGYCPVVTTFFEFELTRNVADSVKNLSEVLDSKNPIGWTYLCPIEVGRCNMKFEDMQYVYVGWRPHLNRYIMFHDGLIKTGWLTGALGREKRRSTLKTSGI